MIGLSYFPLKKPKLLVHHQKRKRWNECKFKKTVFLPRNWYFCFEWELISNTIWYKTEIYTTKDFVEKKKSQPHQHVSQWSAEQVFKPSNLQNKNVFSLFYPSRIIAIPFKLYRKSRAKKRFNKEMQYSKYCKHIPPCLPWVNDV